MADATGLARSLSIAQQHIWAGQQLDPKSPLYNMVLVSTIQGPVDPSRFATAWQQVQREYENLRSHIAVQAGETVRIVGETVSELQVLDLSGEQHPDKALHDLVQTRCERVLDCSRQLHDAALVRLGQSQWAWYCNVHHIVCDATSFTVLFQRLAHHYFEQPDGPETLDTAPSRSAPPHLAVSAESENHWRARAAPNPLPFYGASRLTDTTRSTRTEVPFSEAHQRALKELCALPEARTFGESLSQFVVMATSLVAYLHRISGQTEISIATLLPSRLASQSQAGPDLNVQLLPLQVQVQGADSFANLMARVREEVSQCMRHAYDGANRVVSMNDVSVVLNFATASLGHFGELPATHCWLHPAHSDRNHALRMHVTDWAGSGTLQIAFDHNHGHFSEQARQSSLTHWQQCARVMLEDPNAAIGSVELSGDAAMGDAKASPTQSYANVLNVIDRVAKAHQDEVSVSQNDRQLSYRELIQTSTAIAHALNARGIGRGDRVALHLRRSPELIAIILGVLRCGAAYVPIDASQPSARVSHMLENAQPRLVIGDALLINAMTGVETVSVPTLLNETDSASETTELAPVQSDDPAYVLYTSGSTGAPKGVVVSHQALANYCGWAAEFYGAGKPLVFPLFTSIGFDLTVTSIFVPLMTGGSIHVYPEAQGATDLAVLDIFAQNRVNTVKLTPAHLALLQGQDLSDSTVSQLIVGGEDFKRSLAESIEQSFAGRIKMHNEYGPTEATVGCVVHTFDKSDQPQDSVLIGRAVAGMTSFVLNDQLRQQPAGIVGELYVSGPSLADGYWQQAALTEERFIPNPYLSGQRMYRTGDLVRAQPDGNLVYLGRTDDQVKIKGVRIEMAEIEAAALSHPLVSSCVGQIVDGNAANVAAQEQHCATCGVSTRVPGITLNEHGVCELCTRFDAYSSRANDYFKPMTQLEKLANELKADDDRPYHCMMLLSGGKDSTYALAKLNDLGLRVLAYTLDNGFIADGAKQNIERVCRALGVDHRFGQTEAMNAIFADSLNRYSNVCNGCFKTIYTLSMKLADELNIPYIVTGLSRGQFFETRLTEELFVGDSTRVQDIDDIVLSARKAYHRTADAATTLLGGQCFESDEIFEKVRFIDFYRYSSVTLDEMLDYLDTKLPWVRPSDTGRSTNCLINDIGIYVHKAERGHHNYSVPYSWDVRLGHKQRDAALAELDDDIDEAHVQQVLKQVGYEIKTPEPTSQQLALYFTASDELDITTLRQWLEQRLPTAMLPAHLVALPALPLSANGKVLKSALPAINAQPMQTAEYIAPATSTEKTLARIWADGLQISRIGMRDNFFELGADSLLAIRIVARLHEAGLQLQPADIFEYQTIEALSQVVRVSEDSGIDVPVTKAEPFSLVRQDQLDKLSGLLGRGR